MSAEVIRTLLFLLLLILDHSGNRALLVDTVTTTLARIVGSLWGVGVEEPLSEAALAGAWVNRSISRRHNHSHLLSHRRPLSHLLVRRQTFIASLWAGHLQWAGLLQWVGLLRWLGLPQWALVGLIQWADFLQWAGLLQWVDHLRWAGIHQWADHLQWAVVGSDMGNIHPSSTISHRLHKAHLQICLPGGGFNLLFRAKCHLLVDKTIPFQPCM